MRIDDVDSEFRPFVAGLIFLVFEIAMFSVANAAAKKRVTDWLLKHSPQNRLKKLRDFINRKGDETPQGYLVQSDLYRLYYHNDGPLSGSIGQSSDSTSSVSSFSGGGDSNGRGASGSF